MSKKGENIYKRKDGRWEARYIKGCSTEGKTVYGYCYGKTYREAKVKVTEAKAYLTQKTYIPGVGSRRCLASYCDEWCSRIFCVSDFRQSQEFGSDDCRVRLNSLVCPGSGGRRGMRASGVNAAAASREQ